MPHVIVKLWPGNTEAQKTRLAEKIAKGHRSLVRGSKIRVVLP
jgi:phenylpyruvate tautomerase PptA (4-oxalocrotonate tautomerase family)